MTFFWNKRKVNFITIKDRDFVQVGDDYYTFRNNKKFPQDMTYYELGFLVNTKTGKSLRDQYMCCGFWKYIISCFGVFGNTNDLHRIENHFNKQTACQLKNEYFAEQKR
jgi:hypothetical protein